MPVYQCITSAGAVAAEQRAALATEITAIHTEVTGAPAIFVHVVFLELESGFHYTAGKLDTKSTLVNGIVRAGRSLADRQTLLTRIAEAWTRVTGQPVEELVIAIQEQPASATLEAGLIMPEPGEEQAWFEQNKDKLQALLATQ
ncbi:hypothetical protein D5S17_10375 [Pseudonocardiaceae bacterium YIM PH 21723]|nr:hypothetical protein D5S17_10375 [Pseudonocardiaceae bacterium YIM PH 21723]